MVEGCLIVHFKSLFVGGDNPQDHTLSLSQTASLPACQVNTANDLAIDLEQQLSAGVLQES